MGNDKNFVETQNLPFRFIEIPNGSAPPGSFSTNLIYHRSTKCFCTRVPQVHVEGYDVPPSLSPPPIIPKRYDLYQFNSIKSPTNIKKKNQTLQSKLRCCSVS